MPMIVARNVHCDGCGRTNIQNDGLYKGDPAQAHDDAYQLLTFGMDQYAFCTHNGCLDRAKAAIAGIVQPGKV